MTDPIMGIRWFVVWHVIALAFGAFLAFVAAPWLIGVAYRLRDLKPPKLRSRVGISIVLSVLFFILLNCALVAVMAGIAVIAGEGKAVVPAVLSGVFTVGLITLFRVVLKRAWKPPLRWFSFGPTAVVLTLAAVCVLSVASSSIQRSARMAKLYMDRTIVRNVSVALEHYRDKYDAYPDDLRMLVDANLCSPDAMISPASMTHGPETITQPYDGPVDYKYIRLPEGCPGDLVQVWASPGLYSWEDGIVGYADISVRRLSAEELLAELVRTYEWLVKNAGSGRREAVNQAE